MNLDFDAENFKAWNDLVKQIGDACCYCELRWALLSARSTAIIDKNAVERNINIEKRYHPFFGVIESSLDYSLVLSVCHFFDLPKKRKSGELRSIPFFLNKLNDKIKKGEFNSLRKDHKNSIDKFHNARNDFFAHRKTDKTIIPSFIQTKKLLGDLGKFINSIGKNLPQRAGFIPYDTDDIKRSLDNLLRNLA